MDQMMAHSQKKLNDELTKVVSALPSSERYLFSEMKEEMNEMALCLYNKVTNNLSNKLEGLLLDALDIDNLIAQARGNASDGKQNALGDGERPTTPVVPVCAAEDIMASVIVTNMGEIQDNNDTMLQGVNEFLNDISEKVSGVLGIADQVSKGLGILGGLTQLPNINTSFGAAMLFNNLSLDVFGCEVKPNEAVSDEYTFCSGGSSKPDPETTDPATEDQAVANADQGSPETKPDPGFAVVPPGEPTKRNDGKLTQEELENNQTQIAQTPITQGTSGQDPTPPFNPDLSSLNLSGDPQSPGSLTAQIYEQGSREDWLDPITQQGIDRDIQRQQASLDRATERFNRGETSKEVYERTFARKTALIEKERLRKTDYNAWLAEEKRRDEYYRTFLDG